MTGAAATAEGGNPAAAPGRGVAEGAGGVLCGATGPGCADDAPAAGGDGPLDASGMAVVAEVAAGDEAGEEAGAADDEAGMDAGAAATGAAGLTSAIASGRTCRATRSGSRGVCPGTGHRVCKRGSKAAEGQRATRATSVLASNSTIIKRRVISELLPFEEGIMPDSTGPMTLWTHLNLAGHHAHRPVGPLHPQGAIGLDSQAQALGHGR